MNKIKSVIIVGKNFLTKNWLLLLIAIFSFVSMLNAIDAKIYSEWAYDYAVDANHNAKNASSYAEDAASYAEEAAGNASDAADYASQAADDARYIRIWSY